MQLVKPFFGKPKRFSENTACLPGGKHDDSGHTMFNCNYFLVLIFLTINFRILPLYHQKTPCIEYILHIHQSDIVYQLTFFLKCFEMIFKAYFILKRLFSKTQLLCIKLLHTLFMLKLGGLQGITKLNKVLKTEDLQKFIL